MSADPYQPDLIFRNGRPAAVILPIDRYEAMLEELEQLDDLQAIRAMTEDDRQTISFDQYLRERETNASD